MGFWSRLFAGASANDNSDARLGGVQNSPSPVDAGHDFSMAVKLTEELLGDREQRERALLSVLELSRRADPLGCAALDVAILIKSQGKEGRYTAGSSVFSAGPPEVLQAAKKGLLALATHRILLHDPRRSGEAIAAFMAFADPEAQKELMIGILEVGGDDQLCAFQLLGTYLQATASMKQRTAPGSALDAEFRFEALKGRILERTGSLAEAHGWR